MRKRTPFVLKKDCSCVTCDELLEGRFCHECGEQVYDRRDLKLINYLREVAHQILSLDSKIFITLRVLFLHPGQLTEEYLIGRKLKYIRPMRLYLSSSMLYFFSFAFFDKAALLDVRNIIRFDYTEKLLPALTASDKFSGLAGESFYRAINQQLNNKIAIATVCLYSAFGVILTACTALALYHILFL